MQSRTNPTAWPLPNTMEQLERSSRRRSCRVAYAEEKSPKTEKEKPGVRVFTRTAVYRYFSILHQRWCRLTHAGGDSAYRRSLYRGFLALLVSLFRMAVLQTRRCGSDVLSLVKQLNLKILNSVRIHPGGYGTHGTLPHFSGVLRIDALPSLRYNDAGGSCLKSEGAVARLLLA